jgi:hypothetical protein
MHGELRRVSTKGDGGDQGGFDALLLGFVWLLPVFLSFVLGLVTGKREK